MTSDIAFTNAIEEIDTILGDADAKANLDAGALCALYRRFRGPLEIVIPVIELVPIYGRAIARALRLFMKLADVLCPA